MTIYVMIRDPPYAGLAAKTTQPKFKKSLLGLRLTKTHENLLQCAALNHEGHESSLQCAAPNHEGHETCCSVQHQIMRVMKARCSVQQ